MNFVSIVAKDLFIGVIFVVVKCKTSPQQAANGEYTAIIFPLVSASLCYISWDECTMKYSFLTIVKRKQLFKVTIPCRPVGLVFHKLNFK